MKDFDPEPFNSSCNICYSEQESGYAVKTFAITVYFLFVSFLIDSILKKVCKVFLGTIEINQYVNNISYFGYIYFITNMLLLVYYNVAVIILSYSFRLLQKRTYTDAAYAPRVGT